MKLYVVVTDDNEFGVYTDLQTAQNSINKFIENVGIDAETLEDNYILIYEVTLDSMISARKDIPFHVCLAVPTIVFKSVKK